MTLQVQIEILEICFKHRFGRLPEILFAPEPKRESKYERKDAYKPRFLKSDRLSVQGYGWQLYWDTPLPVMIDPLAEQKAEIRFKEALEELRKDCKPKSSKRGFKPKQAYIPKVRMEDQLERIVKAWEATEQEPYSQFDRDEYTEIEYEKIGGMTPKGVFLDNKFAPFSQMKIDVDNKIYIKNWLYEKEFS